MNLEVLPNALSPGPDRARGAAHRHPAAVVLQHVVRRPLHHTALAGAGVHLSSHHAALVHSGAPLVRRAMDALAYRGDRDRAPDRSVAFDGTAEAARGVTFAVWRRTGAPRLRRAVVCHVHRNAGDERLIHHAVAPRELEKLLPFGGARVGVHREAHADALEPHWHVLRDAERAAEIQITFGGHATAAQCDAERRGDR